MRGTAFSWIAAVAVGLAGCATKPPPPPVDQAGGRYHAAQVGCARGEHGDAKDRELTIQFCSVVIDAQGKVMRRGLQAPPREEAPALILAFFNGERGAWPCSILLRRSDRRLLS